LKLVHNIVLSMPAPTPPEKVLAAARKFAKEKFALQHRYAMALHTDQQNPHVHLVVKAESELGRRLHIDKQLLREWREDFARMMREQGIEANATSRVVRGRNKSQPRDAEYRARQHGKSTALRKRVMTIAQELSQTGAVRDPAHAKLITTRKEIVANWMKAADMLDAQGEIALAGDVRYFANRLPPVLTDKENLARRFIRHIKMQCSAKPEGVMKDRVKEPDLVR
jgi:multidrug efflux pump subunit AcrB